jgi:predicted ABC-type ATPase
MYARRVRDWQSWGFRVSLHFIEVPSADFAVRRVAMRVAAGGHEVPEADVRRRFRRGLDLLARVYKPVVDEWYHWYSDDGGIRLGQHQRR